MTCRKCLTPISTRKPKTYSIIEQEGETRLQYKEWILQNYTIHKVYLHLIRGCYTMATATGQIMHTIHPKKGDNPLETLAPLAHRKRTQQSMGQRNKQRVSRDTVTNPTPNPNPGSPQNGQATWRDIIKKIKKEGLIKGKVNQHNNKSTRK